MSITSSQSPPKHMLASIPAFTPPAPAFTGSTSASSSDTSMSAQTVVPPAPAVTPEAELLTTKQDDNSGVISPAAIRPVLQHQHQGYPSEYDYYVKTQAPAAPPANMVYFPPPYADHQYAAMLPPPTASNHNAFSYYKGYPLNYPPLDAYGQPMVPYVDPRSMQALPQAVKQMPSDYGYPGVPIRIQPSHYAPQPTRFVPTGYAYPHPSSAAVAPSSTAQYAAASQPVNTRPSPPRVPASTYPTESPSKVARSSQSSYGKATRSGYANSSGSNDDSPTVPTVHSIPAVAGSGSGAYGPDSDDSIVFSEELSRAQVANRFGLIFQKYYAAEFPYERIRVWKSKGGLTFYDCSCGKRKPSQGIKKMREHVDRHQSRAAKCDICAQIYEDQSLLRAHSYVHTGQVANCAERLRAIESSISH